YISHRLDEIARIADRITVLRDGCQVGDCDSGAVDRHELIELMVGRKLEQEFPPIDSDVGEEILRAEGLSHGDRVHDVSFNLHAGEIVGLTGLVGAGRTELAHLLFGNTPRDRGRLLLRGEPQAFTSPREAIEAGVCLLTEDRKSQGLVLGRSVRENFGLPNLEGFSRLGFIDQTEERKQFDAYTDRLSIKIPHSEQIAINLSGGNQQKVVLAKWLARNTEVLIFDEPTRGIDVGAKFEIYLLMRDLARDGKAILMISSELPEVIGMCHRVLVMRDGRLVGDLDNQSGSGATQKSILELAMDAHAPTLN
ncbi:MAG: sugar ABC transporter ATP-binding protein, partial [Verrucomicrobiota bacterium]